MTVLAILALILLYICGSVYIGRLFENRMRAREKVTGCLGWGNDDVPCRHQFGLFFGYVLWPILPPLVLLISWLYDSAKSGSVPLAHPIGALYDWRETFRHAAHQRELAAIQRRKEYADADLALQKTLTAKAELERQAVSAAALARADYAALYHTGTD